MNIAYMVFVAVVVFSTTSRPATGQATDADRAMLKTLRAGHPRLIGLPEDFDRVRKLVESDPTAKHWCGELRKEAINILNEPPVVHRLIGPRLLDQSRLALHRIYTLAFFYWLDGDKRFAERATQEMRVIAGFKDWNPSHFLDTAEMTHAMAIGYDWLYDTLNTDDKKLIKTAILELGLKQSMVNYRSKGWWVKVKHNWNQVCNGGMTLGALAVADEEPDIAAYIVSHAVKAVPFAMASYAPDGGWAEGPGYWNYATQYNTYMLAGLVTALGTDFGLGKAPGFSQTGLFPLQFTGPTGRTFNYADGGEREGKAECLFWLAKRYNKPIYAWLERNQEGRPNVLDLLWYDPTGVDPGTAHIPLCSFYKGINVVFMRNGWQNPEALFVGFKGGDNQANHSHLDLGTFVLDADGQRWATDLGSDDYNMPGYFGNKRFSYYRLGTPGHNTITLDGANQNEKAAAPIAAFNGKRGNSFAIADLSAGYAGQASSVKRGVSIVSNKGVLIEDEVNADVPVEYVWSMHTTATVQVSGDTATLSQNGKTFHAFILEPKDARFDTMSAFAPKPQKPNTGITKLVVRLPSKVESLRLVVLLYPESAGKLKNPVVKPLSEWR